MARSSAKVVQLSTRETMDHDTGVLVRSEHEQVLRFPPEPEFIKLYLADLSALLDVPPGPQGVLMALVKKLDYEGVITLSPASRERIANLLGIKIHTLANYITLLCEKQILRRTGRGEYEMNPHLMARGSWADILKRRASFELVVTYRSDGTRTIRGEVEPQGELPLRPDELHP